VDHLLLMSLHGGEIEGRLPRDNPETFHFLQVRIVFAAGQERLGWDAAPVGAGPAPEIFLDNRHPGAVAGGMFRQGMTAGSGADNDKVEYIRQNGFPPRSLDFTYNLPQSPLIRTFGQVDGGLKRPQGDQQGKQCDFQE
jgi:hypothetical protein